MDRPSSTPSPSALTTAIQAGMCDHPLSPHTHPGSIKRRPSSFTSSTPAPPRPISPTPPDCFEDRYDPGSGSGSDVLVRIGSGVVATTDELLGNVTVSPGRGGLNGSARSSPEKRAGRVGWSERIEGLEGMTESEMEVVRMQWDKMGDEEINKVLSDWDNRDLDSSSMTKPDASITDQPAPVSTTDLTNAPSEPISISAPPDQPLFPPSPPPIPIPFIDHPTEDQAGKRQIDHPLRVLARAVLELQEVVGRLRRENEELRMELGRGKEGEGTVRERRGVDAASLHDGLSEAISTSLTSPPILSVQSVHSGKLPHPPRVPSPAPSTSSHRSQQSRARSPNSSIYRTNPTGLAPSNRSVRSVDSRHGDIPLPSNRSVRSVDLAPRQNHPSPVSANKKREVRSSWTASLWGWGNGSSGSSGKRGVQRDRKGSVSSSPREEIRQAEYDGQKGQEGEEGDEEGWRKGDGGSSPGYKAIFLATRLLTPDPLSILSPSHIQPNSLLAYLAHSLVSTARDEGITVKEPPHSRRRASRETRSRAASIISQESQYTAGSRDHGETSTSGKDKSYTDTLAATASYGRSLFSSVSGSTLRGARSKAASISVTGEETIRPSLLSRTSARTFPTTAITPTITSDPSTNTNPDGQSLPSVEMASIVADENQPPTVLLSRRHLGGYFQTGKVGVVATRFSGADPPLTDRYGFIYDIQHAGMLKDASIAGAPAPASLNGIIPGLEEGEGWIESRRRTSQDTRPELSRRSTGSTASTRSSPSIGISQTVESSPSNTSGRATPTGKRSTPKDHADNRHRSSTVISLNPSPARPVTAKDTLTVSARGASSLRSAISSPIVDPSPTKPDAAVSRATVSSLLDKLTDIHDRQQAERKAEWDVWIRKHRAKGSKKEKGKIELGGEEAGWGGDMIGISQMGLGDAEEWRAFAKLVRRGIPLAYRADIWAECSGAKDEHVPGEYQEILSVHASDTLPVLADIEKDVSRTFPGNMFFGGDGPGVAKLRRVLVAYSWRNPSVGYCQGMNMLAATLLLTHTDEEQAFWVLSAMLDRLLPKDFYSPSLLASRTDQLVLADLVALHLPKLSGHLDELGVDLASITFGWFLSLFTDCLPVETLFRVWDVFFVEGHDTLFRVALAILKMNEAEICLTESAGDLFVFVSGMTSRLWAADKLIALQHGYKSTVKHTDISGRYTRHLASLQEM